MATKSKKNTKKTSTKSGKKQSRKTPKAVSPAYVDKNVETYSDDTAIFVPSNLKVYQTDDALLLNDNVNNNNNADEFKLKDEEPASPILNNYSPYKKTYRNNDNIVIAIGIVLLLSMLVWFAV